MIIAIDFDGTCVKHSFPALGEDIGAVPVLKRLVASGHQLILWTMRSDAQQSQIVDGYEYHTGDFLTQAEEWFRGHGIPLYGVQRNPTQDEWTTSPKAYAQLYIDDAALGCPLVCPVGERPYVDWRAVEEILVAGKVITNLNGEAS